MRTTATMLVLLALAAPRIRAQEQEEPRSLEQRIVDARTALREVPYRTLVAGSVRDRTSGNPIAGASVGADVWRAAAFDANDLSDVAPLLTDREGQFAGLLPVQPFAVMWSADIHVLVQAPGHVPSVVRFPRSLRFHGAGYGLDVEMDRELVLELVVTDEGGAPWSGGEIGWLLLSHDVPCREGRALLDAQGRGFVRTCDFSRPDGLALHVWTPVHSARVTVPAGDVVQDDSHVMLRCELRRTPPPILAAISTATDLQKRDIGFLDFGCVQSTSHADAFELTLVSLEDSPGPPVRHAWNGRPTSIALPTVRGRTRATVRLDRASKEFLRLDAGRGRLDAGPDFARATASITEDHPHLSLDESRVPYGSDRAPDDVVRIAPAPRQEEDDVSPKPPRPTKDQGEEVTLELSEKSWSEDSVLLPLMSGVRVGRLHARDDAFLVPRSWLPTVEVAVLEPRGSLRHAHLETSRFARGPLLLELVATTDPDVHRLRLAPRVDRLTLFVRDAAGDPVSDLTLRFRGTGLLDRSAAMASFGLAFEAATGLPHATMMTDAQGELRLRDVPTGVWTLDLLGKGTPGLRRELTVAPGTSRVVLSTH